MILRQKPSSFTISRIVRLGLFKLFLEVGSRSYSPGSTMAKLASSFFIPLAAISFLLSSSLAAAKTSLFSRNISPLSLGLGEEKLSHLHFYFHDIVSGPKPSAVRVAAAGMTNSSPTGFGAVVMMDDPLTASPELSSTLVGRAQGIYASASQEEAGFLMVLNFAFTEGKYNGSNLSVLGRNKVLTNVREMPIVGGSGAFRFARGYAQASTHAFDPKTGDAVVEYNVYVFHY